MLDLELFDNHMESSWCPGCGNFPLRSALKRALAESEIPPNDVVVVSGIGQAAKMPHYMNCNYFNGLHGRALPPAQAIKMSNHDLNVVVTTGDGDCYGEGGNHFLHAIRRNVNITLIVHDNQIYGLTKGQASPTTALGQITTMQTHGVQSMPMNPLALAVSQGCGFVARGYVGEEDHLVDLIRQGIAYKGFAIIDVLQPCVSFNKINTYKWYKDRCAKIAAGHDQTDIVAAFKLALQFGDSGIPIGVIYKNDELKSFEALHSVLNILKEPLAKMERKPQDALPYLAEFI